MTRDFRIADFAFSTRVLSTCVLLFFVGVHGFALWLSKHVGEMAGSAQTHFQYKDLTYMLRMSHQHLFGHGAMYFIVGWLFLGTDWRDKAKAAMVALPFLGAALDLASWWLLKHGATDWEWLSMTGGTLFTLSFLAMVLVLLWQLWRPTQNRAAPAIS